MITRIKTLLFIALIVPVLSSCSHEQTFPCSYVDETMIDGFINRSYMDHKGNVIANSFAFNIDDHVIDMDGDGINELICNCMYGADGHQEVRIYKARSKDIYLAVVRPDENNAPDYKDISDSCWSSYYDPESNSFILSYPNNSGSITTKTITGLKDLSFIN